VSVVIVDIDDVLYPWYGRAHQACVVQQIVREDPVPQTYAPHEEYGIELEEWIDIVRVATLNGFLHSADPIDGALDGLHALEEAGWEIQLVTTRGGWPDFATLVKEQTREWLHDWRVPHRGLHFVKSKGTVAQVLGASHAIDDLSKNYYDLTAAGCRTYLQNRPWNADEKGISLRVSDMREFALALNTEQGL
jgi:hypothetical protein